MFYTAVIWALNMLILGLSSGGIFLGKGKWKNYIKNGLFLIILAMPLFLPFSNEVRVFMEFVSLVYVVFFCFIFYEIMKFLIKPSYINADIISASLCGYLLLIEISVFALQFLFYQDPTSLSNIDSSNPASIYVDLVYFSTIIQTTIGFGDISPASPNTKLLVAMFGIIGQFYTVVLIGVLLSKFNSRQAR